MANAKEGPIPEDKIQEVASQYPEVLVKFWRRNTRGQFAALGKYTLISQELADIDSYIRGQFGGGKFRVSHIASPDNPSVKLIDDFEFDVDAPVKPTGARDGFDGGGGQHFASPMPMMPARAGWGQDLPPSMQAQMLSRPNAPVNSFSSDQIAVQQLEQTREELERERKLREEDRKSFESRFDKLTKQIEEEREERRKQEVKAQQDLQRKELEAITSRLEAKVNQKPSFDASGIAAIVGAAVPLITAFVKSSSDRDNFALERQTQMMTSQMQMMTAVAGKSGDNKQFVEMFKVIAPVAIPVLKDWWESKSPKAQADLVATMAENQLTTVSMMLNMAKEVAAQSAEGAPQWWMPMFDSVVRSIQQMTEGVGKTTKESVGLTQQKQQQTQVIPAHAGTQGEQITTAVFADPNLPQEFRTEMWFKILVAIHNRGPVEPIGKAIAEYLGELDEQHKLPPILHTVWDHPQETLMQVFGFLPISRMDLNYTQSLVASIIKILSQDPEQTANLQTAAQEVLDRKGIVEMAAAPVVSQVQPMITPTPAPSQTGNVVRNIPFDLGEEKLVDVLPVQQSTREPVPA